MRILLDSNIWRYFVDADAILALDQAQRRTKHSIVIAPAVLFEAARNRDDKVRRLLLTAMTRRSWKRLMPEAYWESEELKAEVRRLRPEWMRPRPNLQPFIRLRYDWLRAKGGLWDRIHNDAQYLQSVDEDFGQKARDQAYQMRDDSREWSPKWRTVSLTSISAMPASPRAGWDGTNVEAWRSAAESVFQHILLFRPSDTAIEWIRDEVDVELMRISPASLVKFWYHDVEVTKMPRYWLRWAFEFLQRQQRTTDGTPVDSQLGTYLIEVDHFLTADKLFVMIAERCRADAPFRIARSTCIPAAGAVDTVLQTLRDL